MGSVTATIVSIVMVAIALICAGGAFYLAVTPTRDSDRFIRRAVMGGLGVFAALLAILATIIFMNSGPPTAQDLCTSNTYNRFPQGQAECVPVNPWPWDYRR